MKNKKLFAILTLVCFMFTLMPVAAFAAAPFDEQSSTVGLADDSISKGDTVVVELDMNAATATTIYVWFEEVGYENIVVNAVTVEDVDTEDNEACTVSGTGVIAVEAEADYAEFAVQMNRVSDFVVHAGTVNPADAADWKLVEAKEFRAANDVTVTVEPAADVSAKYALKVGAVDADVDAEDGYIENKEVATVVLPAGPTTTNGIETFEFAFNLVLPERYTTGDNKGDIVPDGDETKINATALKVDTTSGIVADVDASRSGKVELEVSVLKAGSHKVYFTIGDYKATIKFDARNGEAEDIEVSYISKTPVNIESANGMLAMGQGLGNWLVFQVYDANGREVKDGTVGSGIVNAATADGNNNYVSLIEQPADSKLKAEQFALVYEPELIKTLPVVGDKQVIAEAGWTIKADAGVSFKEEGKYTFKVALDDGTYAIASITLKEAGDPVMLSIAYDADSVQLGGSIAPKAISWLDANYVASAAEDIKFAATGAAIDYVDGTTIYVKADEKYIGSTIKVTVVDEENNLVATKTLTVSDEANALAFNVEVVPVDVDKKVTVTLVDGNGKVVALPNADDASASVIVLSKPAGAEATVDSISTVNPAKGQFDFTFSADKAGVYEVQAILQVKIDDAWRYYTGTQEIKVGATGIEDTVVMSIGANKVVVNDKVVAIDAAPMIKDSRTFVPFRALAEAFGAVVEFDAATQAVVAELDGTKVVMTIGAKDYTVNGVAKTADVAPFISDSRTMVPVRFVAEAFGITVTPIYAEDGSVADVLFTK